MFNHMTPKNVWRIPGKEVSNWSFGDKRLLFLPIANQGGQPENVVSSFCRKFSQSHHNDKDFFLKYTAKSNQVKSFK